MTQRYVFDQCLRSSKMIAEFKLCFFLSTCRLLGVGYGSVPSLYMSLQNIAWRRTGICREGQPICRRLRGFFCDRCCQYVFNLRQLKASTEAELVMIGCPDPRKLRPARIPTGPAAMQTTNCYASSSLLDYFLLISTRN